MRASRLKNAGTYALLVLFSIIALLPICWALLTSLKTTAGIHAFPPQWVPSPATLDHYESVVFRSNAPLFFGNSLLVAFASIGLTLLVAVHAGYGAARFNFPGKQGILFLILATAMVPGIAVLVPLYLMAVRLNLHDTHGLLVLVYSAWQAPTVIWLIRGFIENTPAELEEAAMIDGCSRIGAFYRIITPVIKPGLAAAAILVFVYVWNDFIISMALTISEHKRLIQVGLYRYLGDLGVEWGRFMAYTMLALLPVIVLFTALQKRFIRGLTGGALKG